MIKAVEAEVLVTSEKGRHLKRDLGMDLDSKITALNNSLQSIANRYPSRSYMKGSQKSGFADAV